MGVGGQGAGGRRPLSCGRRGCCVTEHGRWQRLNPAVGMPSATSPAFLSWHSVIQAREQLDPTCFSTLRILPRSGSTAWYRRSRACFVLPPAGRDQAGG